MWTKHTRTTVLPTVHKRPTNYRNEMCPASIVMSHPAGELLAKWAQLGCPTKTGCPWSNQVKLICWDNIMHSWIQADSLKWGVPFQELESMAAKVRHAFMALPGDQCLLSPCNQLLKRRPQEVYFHQNKPLILAIGDGRWELTGNSLGAQWELSGSSLGALWELVAVAGIFFMRLQSDQVIVLSAWDAM